MSPREQDRDDEDADEGADVPPLGPPRPRAPRGEPAKKTKLRSRSSSETRSESTTRDLGAIFRAAGDAFSSGGSHTNQAFENLSKAYEKLLDRLGDAHVQVATLSAQLVAAQSANPALALLQTQAQAAAETAKIETQQKWQTVRDVGPQLAAALGPHAGPVLAWVAKKFGMTDVPAPAAGDKSPRAAVQRVLRRLMDGSEQSVVMTQMLQEYVVDLCGEDFSVVMEFFAAAASAPDPVPAGEAAP